MGISRGEGFASQQVATYKVVLSIGILPSAVFRAGSIEDKIIGGEG